jgi:hypothetical protein
MEGRIFGLSCSFDKRLYERTASARAMPIAPYFKNSKYSIGYWLVGFINRADVKLTIS